MSTPRETAAEALTDLHYGHQDEEGYAELLREGVFFKDAEAALASLAQHRDDIARVAAKASRDWPGRDDPLATESVWEVVADAVLAYLTGDKP